MSSLAKQAVSKCEQLHVAALGKSSSSFVADGG